MKRILSDLVNLIFPKPEGKEWNWGEIILVLGLIGLLSSVLLSMSV